MSPIELWQSEQDWVDRSWVVDQMICIIIIIIIIIISHTDLWYVTAADDDDDDVDDDDAGYRAGLSIVPVVPWEGAPVARGPPINCQIFTTLFWRLTTTAMTKKVINFLGEEKCTPREKIPPWVRVWETYEKRTPALRWYGAPEWLIRPWLDIGNGGSLCRLLLLSLILVASLNSLNLPCSRLPQTNRTDSMSPLHHKTGSVLGVTIASAARGRHANLIATWRGWAAQFSLRDANTAPTAVCSRYCCCCCWTDCDGRFSTICDSN